MQNYPIGDIRPRYKQTLFLVFFLCSLSFALRLGYVTAFVGLATPPEYDEISYHLLARNLMNGNGYTLESPTAFRPPGYPLFLAGVYALGGEGFPSVRLLHAILGSLLVALTYATAVAIFRVWQIAALAALGVAMHPVLIYLSAFILTETVFITLCMTVIWLMASNRGQLTLVRTLAMAVVLGGLVLMRPSVMIFAASATLWCVFVTQDRRRGMFNAAIMVAVIVLFILPWTIRNYVQFHEFIPLATEGGVTFWSGNNAWATGGVVEPSAASWAGSDPPISLQGWTGLSETESEDRFYAATLSWIRSNPQDFFALLPRKLARAWSLAYGNEARPSLLPGWVATLYLLFPLTSLAGLILSLQFWCRLVPIYLLIGSFTLTTLVFYGSTRQSAVLFPSAAILAAYAIIRASIFVRDRLNWQRGCDPA